MAAKYMYKTLHNCGRQYACVYYYSFSQAHSYCWVAYVRERKCYEGPVFQHFTIWSPEASVDKFLGSGCGAS